MDATLATVGGILILAWLAGYLVDLAWIIAAARGRDRGTAFRERLMPID